jgi:7-carboxy-7-deazaguanine synthase
MQISEIYKSIQGESRFAGLPCVFVRSTGCNLRCVWCDTAYAFYGGKVMSIGEILAEVMQYECSLVEITGGEPLLQKDTPELAGRLLDLDCRVLVETSGERDISVLPAGVIKIMDIKCPGSGEMERNRLENLDVLCPEDEVKFVIRDRNDYEWACEFVNRHELDSRSSILFSPVFGELQPKALVEWILADNLNVRFQLQLHKLVWSPDMQGV